MTELDAKGLHYRLLNDRIRSLVTSGEKEICLHNVNGQRYIGDGIKSTVKIDITGVPGNDLAMFMDGPTITVYNNAQDGVGNTMNSGLVVVHGDSGDIVGHAMRGGTIFVKGDVGYRVGIHMKSYKDLRPVIVVGGLAYDFLGEYMAGGIIIILALPRQDKTNLPTEQRYYSRYIGTGMHGGTIYYRGKLESYQLGKEVGLCDLEEADKKLLSRYIKQYSTYFGYDTKLISPTEFIKLYPKYLRPYGRLYAY